MTTRALKNLDGVREGMLEEKCARLWTLLPSWLFPPGFGFVRLRRLQGAVFLLSLCFFRGKVQRPRGTRIGNPIDKMTIFNGLICL
ncbi:hypothetical protein EUGRSUZ_F03863 [Eucalyptus grandis]|uniref:Uncharacterized protein n=2 Tax=Eucalyptus grandis TaxID=71139 RepID=A0ACC3KMX4_EUCGR|nr:hypothetical protein EUGRSUZ_F03863 [Eucalyptus grandis]